MNEKRLNDNKIGAIRAGRDVYEDQVFHLEEKVTTLKEEIGKLEMAMGADRGKMKQIKDSRNRMSDSFIKAVEQANEENKTLNKARDKIKYEIELNKELADSIKQLKREKRNLQAKLRRQG